LPVPASLAVPLSVMLAVVTDWLLVWLVMVSAGRVVSAAGTVHVPRFCQPLSAPCALAACR
jgi:hypothetical protein